MLLEIQEIIKNRSVVLYGLGTETDRVIREWTPNVKIVGLLDSFKEEGEQFGYPILSVREVVKRDDIIIIVVARPGSCKAIARKIGSLCKENNIEVYDIRGNNLLETNKVVYDLKAVKGYQRVDVLEKMKDVEIVSFDLFDTLIVRKALSHSDVIEIMEARLKEQGTEMTGFCDRRISLEKRLSQGRAPRLCEIYEKLLEHYPKITLTASELAIMEFETDLSLVEPRTDVIELIKSAKDARKKVCITTDTYYGREELQKVFDKNKICGFDEVFISCEYGIGKKDGLFDKVIQKFGTNHILHIGDDVSADIEAAQAHDIQSFKIYSSVELFDAVGGLGLPDYETCLSDRIKTGMFIAKVFNGAFAFEDEKRKIQLKTAKMLGYLFCAPMILDFSCWFEEQLRQYNLKNVWFGARDGYLLQRVFDLLYPTLKTVYFLISRTAAIRAGVENEADIAYVDSMKFSGTEEENLRKRFGLCVERLDVKDIDAQRDGMLKYSKAILDNAQVKRQNYLRYMNGTGFLGGDIAFFDFVAKGTSQMFLEKVLAKDIVGLYFLQLEQEFMKDKGLKIYSFYDGKDTTSAIFDNYYILETILTSPEPSVDEFTEDGTAVYAQETRPQDDIACIMQAQEGILEYVETYVQICPKAERRINKKLDELFLTLIHNVEILDKNFLQLKVEDPFFNRQTDIVDVL